MGKFPWNPAQLLQQCFQNAKCSKLLKYGFIHLHPIKITVLSLTQNIQFFHQKDFLVIGHLWVEIS